MATVRFLKLPEEKKKRILLAGFQEFARYPYRDASINRIIKNAEISRGSFYTYFEDKMGLLCFILAEMIGRFNEEVYGFLKEDKGDPFLCAERVYTYCRNELKQNEALGFVKNLFTDTETLKQLMIPAGKCGAGSCGDRDDTAAGAAGNTGDAGAAGNAGDAGDAGDAKQYIHTLLEELASRVNSGIDHEKYDLDDEKVKFLYPMIMMVTIRTATTAAEFPEREDALRHGMEMELELLKYGAARRNNTERPEEDRV